MKNKYQMITKRQGNRIFILESFSAAALFLPQLVLKENKGSAVLSVIAACIFIGIYFWIAAKTAKGISMENVLKEHPWAAVFYYIRFLSMEHFIIFISFLWSVDICCREGRVFLWDSRCCFWHGL